MPLMVIFSMGGLALRRHASPNRLRCRPSVINLESPEIDVVLDPWPDRSGQGVVVGGRVRVTEAGIERELRARPAPGRWDDVELLEYAARALWSWIAVPLSLEDGPGVVRDDERAVLRYEQGDVVHELSGHCDFGGVLVATRRRTRSRGRHGVPLEWADLVAAHMIPNGPTKPLNQ